MAKQPQVPQAFFDEFGNSADDRVMDYGRACYEAGTPQSGSWLPAEDVYRHARTIDVALNGEDGAASRPALCDVVAQIASLARQHGPLAAALAAPAAAGAQGEVKYQSCTCHTDDAKRLCMNKGHCVVVTAQSTPQPAAADGGVRERARELLAAEYAKDTDSMLSLVYAQRLRINDRCEPWAKELSALEQALTQQPALSSHRQAGDVLCHRVRFQGDSVCPGGPVWRAGDIPASELAYWEAAGSHYWIERAYDYPPDPATLTRVHRLLENWERQAQLHGVRTFTGNDHLIFANELRAALVEKGAGNG